MDSATIHGLVKMAKNLVGGLMCSVTLESNTGMVDGYGTPSYAAAVTYKAFLKEVKQKIVLKDGTEVAASSELLFLEPVTIKTTDRITLPDGTKPDILHVDGMTDSTGTGRYTTKVYFNAGLVQGTLGG